jgi:beta-phosphoglucomutase family hydrolase
MMSRVEVGIDTAVIRAVVFDMDGVVTDTASVHAAAWKQLFDEYLRNRAGGADAFVPFDAVADYLPYIDGKPRYDGVRSFLASRGITLPEGDVTDPPDRETVRGLGNRKDGYFLDRLRRDGAQAYASTVKMVRRLSAMGVGTAIISASRNMTEVLRSAGLDDLFDVRVDGVMADRLELPGKPEPAVFLEAAHRLGAAPQQVAIVEDAVAGVEAGRRGGFALVIGVDRGGNRRALTDAGADVVVADVSEVRVA